MVFPKIQFPVLMIGDLIGHNDSGIHTGPVKCGQGPWLHGANKATWDPWLHGANKATWDPLL